MPKYYWFKLKFSPNYIILLLIHLVSLRLCEKSISRKGAKTLSFLLNPYFFILLFYVLMRSFHTNSNNPHRSYYSHGIIILVSGPVPGNPVFFFTF